VNHLVNRPQGADCPGAIKPCIFRFTDTCNLVYSRDEIPAGALPRHLYLGRRCAEANTDSSRVRPMRRNRVSSACCHTASSFR
jgi:hypothetical protein